MAEAPTAREEMQIGKILVQNELISNEQLRECMELQKKVKEVGGSILLGELVVQKGYVDEPTLKGALAVQQEKLAHALMIHPLRQKGLTAEVDLSIGKLAIQNNLVVQEQVEGALELQKRVRALGVEKHLGEILVDRGYISHAALEGLLRLQENRKRKATEVELKAVGFGTAAPENRTLALVPDAFVDRVCREQKVVPASLIAECREVQRKLAGMGLAKSLGDVLLSKGYLTGDAAKRIAAQHAVEGNRRPHEEGVRGSFLAPRDIAAIIVVVALALYVVFRTREGDAPLAPPPPPPAVPPPPTVASPGGSGGGTPPRAVAALAVVPQEEIALRGGQFLQETVFAALGALREARGVTTSAEKGKAFGARDKFRDAEFQRWFEAWRSRTRSIQGRDPALRDRLKPTNQGTDVARLDEALRLVEAYGTSRRGDLIEELHLPLAPMDLPSEGSQALYEKARGLLVVIASSQGFDLPEEEEEEQEAPQEE